jgi:hypothetical protein
VASNANKVKLARNSSTGFLSFKQIKIASMMLPTEPNKIIEYKNVEEQVKEI